MFFIRKGNLLMLLLAFPSMFGVLCEQVPAYLHAGARQFGFMLRGLKELEGNLAALNIPFFLLKGDPAVTIPGLVADTKAGLLVADFGPLRLGREWRDKASPVTL
jgi:deoxyribodipyrimidine photo-lyase